jgi:hypothetical protein
MCISNFSLASAQLLRAEEMRTTSSQTLNSPPLLPDSNKMLLRVTYQLPSSKHIPQNSPGRKKNHRPIELQLSWASFAYQISQQRIPKDLGIC